VSGSRRPAKASTYGGRTFRSLKGAGFKANYFDAENGARFWISGCRKDGKDRLYGERVPVEIDEDAREEYWTVIRGEPAILQLALGACDAGHRGVRGGGRGCKGSRWWGPHLTCGA
jgi:hypothetical protein